MPDSDIQLTLPEELNTSEIKDEILQAMWYLYYRNNLNYTMQQIAEAMNWTARDSVYKAMRRWKKSGAFQKAEEIILMPQIVEAQLANQRVIKAWPEIIDRQVDIAINSRSDKNSTTAAEFLKTEIYNPIMEQVAEDGGDESAYAKRPNDVPPDIIVLPAHLVKAVIAKPEEVLKA